MTLAGPAAPSSAAGPRYEQRRRGVQRDNTGPASTIYRDIENPLAELTELATRLDARLER